MSPAQLSLLERDWRAAAGPLRADSAASALISLLPAAPIIDVQSAEELVGCSNQAARLALAQLEQAGIISQLTVGRRNRAWEASAVFEVLNAFERHLATRRGGKTRLAQTRERAHWGQSCRCDGDERFVLHPQHITALNDRECERVSFRDLHDAAPRRDLLVTP